MAKKENRPAVDPLAGLAYGKSKEEREEQRRLEEQNRQEEQRRQEELRKQDEARMAEEKKTAEAAVQVQEPVKETDRQTTVKENKSAAGQGNLASVYAEKKKNLPQTRSVRLQVVITPAISERLDKLVENREIRSKNDLINFLLESYFDMLNEAE